MRSEITLKNLIDILNKERPSYVFKSPSALYQKIFKAGEDFLLDNEDESSLMLIDDCVTKSGRDAYYLKRDSSDPYYFDRNINTYLYNHTTRGNGTSCLNHISVCMIVCRLLCIYKYNNFNHLEEFFKSYSSNVKDKLLQYKNTNDIIKTSWDILLDSSPEKLLVALLLETFHFQTVKGNCSKRGILFVYAFLSNYFRPKEVYNLFKKVDINILKKDKQPNSWDNLRTDFILDHKILLNALIKSYLDTSNNVISDSSQLLDTQIEDITKSIVKLYAVLRSKIADIGPEIVKEKMHAFTMKMFQKYMEFEKNINTYSPKMTDNMHGKKDE